MTTAKIKRDDVLRLKVAPEMRERLDRLSRLLGMPPSTLAALAVGHWVASQERAFHLAERMLDQMSEQLGEEMTSQLREQIGLFTKDGGGDA
jgi:predicted DNA-binding protein